MLPRLLGLITVHARHHASYPTTLHPSHTLGNAVRHVVVDVIYGACPTWTVLRENHEMTVFGMLTNHGSL